MIQELLNVWQNFSLFYSVQTNKNFVALWEEKLQNLEIDQVFSGERCAKKFPGLGLKGVHEKQICARVYYTKKKTQCVSSGDSGAPLYSTKGVNDLSDNKYLRGIVSIGPTICGSVSYWCVINVLNLLLKMFFSFSLFRS